MTVVRRYGLVTALLYDTWSGEWPLYRVGRLAAIDALRLSPGDRVLVLGCGTGLDLPLIARAVGPRGLIVAVDRSPVMLRRAAARARDRRDRRRADWPALQLVLADATRASSLLPPGSPPVDAVLAVNTLSLIPDWNAAWRRAIAAARPGARVAVADIGRPEHAALPLRLWAPLISWIGGGRLDARPWRAVEQECSDVSALSLHAGHVHLRAGTLP